MTENISDSAAADEQCPLNTARAVRGEDPLLASFAESVLGESPAAQ
jgi:hypothetical protein